MPGKKILNYAPALYGGFFPSFFFLPVPPERHATCDSCAMVAADDPPASNAQHFFSATSKCCTYYPRIPNYLVGGLLDGSDPHLEEGRARITGTIDRRIGVTPRGIAPPRKYSSLYQLGLGAFGRAQSLVCPYYDADGGACTVWDHRAATCSTYFCKYNFGKDGWLFWEALREYLAFTEQILSGYALDRLSWSAESILGMESNDTTSLGADELDDAGPGDEEYEAIWGDWAGREEELYRRTFEIVSDLDRDEYERISGIEQTLRLKKLQSRYSEMIGPLLPDVLIRNPRLVVEPAGRGFVLLQGYGPVDPRRVRRELYHLLDRFDGTRPWRDVVSEARAEGVDALTDGLVTQLYHHRILIGK